MTAARTSSPPSTAKTGSASSTPSPTSHQHLAHQVVSYGFGEVYARPGLTHAQRQLVALGGCEPQVEVHVNASLNVGLTPTEIVEAITHTAVYCGFPKALNAIFVAKRVFAERDLLPVNAPAA